MNYYKYSIQHDVNQSEIVLAFLSQLPFEAFQEENEILTAWLAANHKNDDFQQRFEEVKTQFNLSVEIEEVAPQNWNAIWEAEHESITVGNFCQVRADFHEVQPDVLYDIIINPKMAFGTGHHETTYMMMDQMKDLKFDKKQVLDLGCGTGVLAILAAKMGAAEIIAIDNDPAAYENTLENLKVNQIEGINTLLGTLKDVPIKPYDYILANINRSVILESLSSLYQGLKPEGLLLVSGIITTDEELLLREASKNKLKKVGIQYKNGWICAAFMRN